MLAKVSLHSRTSDNLMIPHVHILMCTKDGGDYLAAQLVSILAQTHNDWSLWISDDGSRDETLDLIAECAAAHPARQIRVIDGPRMGVAANFLSLLARPEFERGWIAFADQDDIWMPHKLARGVEMVRRGTGAEIYASRSIVTDAAMQVADMSRAYSRPFDFGNALVQNVLTGNTLVIPPRITDYLRAALRVVQPSAIPFHDWWIYQMVTAAGFDVLHDRKPGLFYRQHGRNVLGAQQGHIAHRARLVLQGDFASWIDANIEILHQIEPLLTGPNRRLLGDVSRWRKERGAGFRPDPSALGLYRQTVAGDVALRVMARMGLI